MAADVPGNNHVAVTVPATERWVIRDFTGVNEAEATQSGDLTLAIAGHNGPNLHFTQNGPLSQTWNGWQVARGGEQVVLYNNAGTFIAGILTGYRFTNGP